MRKNGKSPANMGMADDLSMRLTVRVFLHTEPKACVFCMLCACCMPLLLLHLFTGARAACSVLRTTQRCTAGLKPCARTASPPPISAWQMTCQCAWQYHSYMPLLLLHCSLRRVLLVESSIPLSAVQPGSSYALERRVPCQHGMAEDPPPRLTAHQLHALACTASLH